MSELPISSPYRSTPNAPVSDAEREQLNSRLNAAFTAGTIDQDQYQSRLDLLFSAQRMGDLLGVVEGLPPLQTYNTPAIVQGTGAQPGELSVARPANKLALIAVGSVAAAVLIVVILLLILL